MIGTMDRRHVQQTDGIYKEHIAYTMDIQYTQWTDNLNNGQTVFHNDINR